MAIAHLRIGVSSTSDNTGSPKPSASGSVRKKNGGIDRDEEEPGQQADAEQVRRPQHQVEALEDRTAHGLVGLGVVAASSWSVRERLLLPQLFSDYHAATDERPPVLILHGGKYRLVPVEASRRAVARRPSWTLVTHPDLGHVVQLEAPEWTVARIREWQSSRRASTAAG